MKGVFITGTDTGVGKTAACAALVSLLRHEGIDAVPMKPVQTGAIGRAGRLCAPDLEFCLAMAGLQVSDEEKRLMAPYCFEKPCSPHLASTKTGEQIDISVIRESFLKLAARHRVVVAEGAGGVLVPIGEQKTMLDIMVALNIPVVLVSRPGLGTINHTLLSLREIKRSGLSLAGVIIVETGQTPRGDIEEDNIRTIERMGRVRVLGRIPFIERLERISKPQDDCFERIMTELPSASEWMKLI